uniref:MYND-type domain-containing protein n=1 Tax=Panagrolaimus sp. PS1159 TaxID=55785 RepID=A0AC35EUM8_9BILA
MEKNQHNNIINHCRILQLLGRGSDRLKDVFRERWLIYSKLNPDISQWENNHISGCNLVKLCAPEISPEIKEKLKSGLIDLWDITATNNAINVVSKEIKKLGENFNNKEYSYINSLRKVRNKITHNEKYELPNEEFLKQWDHLASILVKLGDNESDIKKLKQSLMNIGQIADNSNSDSNEKSEFIKLRTMAKNVFKEKQYEEAIKIYNQMLQLSGNSPENQALIYSNKSAAYLSLKDEMSLKMAKRDAEMAINLWPCWWKGYFRLGRAETELKNFEEAEKALVKATALNSQSKEVETELRAVQFENRTRHRKDHLNPAYYPQSYEELYRSQSQQLGMPEKEIFKYLDEDILNGEKWRFGHNGGNIDFVKAAGFFEKAINKNKNIKPSSYAMLQLAEMYQRGEGVKRDYGKAFDLRMEVATSKIEKIDYFIADAQFRLGLMYSNGEHVKQDYNEAVRWFEKSVQLGHAAAANNLATCYTDGKGIEKSNEKAFQYFKIAAERGNTSAMLNLSTLYFSATGTGSILCTEEDKAEGIKWLRIASEKGNLNAQKKLEEYETKPIDYEYTFKQDYAAKKGSVTAQKHMEIWKHLENAMEAFKKKDFDKLVSCVSKAIRMDVQIVSVNELFMPMIKKRIKTHPDDLETIVCYVQQKRELDHVNKTKNALPLVEKYLKKFPTDEYLLHMKILLPMLSDECDVALIAATTALSIHPNSLALLYEYGVVLASLNNDECIKTLDKFLDIAPKDHFKVPASHYLKAYYYFNKEDVEKFMDSYEAGLAAEKKQLECFKPYKFLPKELSEKCYLALKENLDDENNVKSQKLNTRLEEIKNGIKRKTLLLWHRKAFAEGNGRKDLFMLDPAPKISKKPISLKDLKKIVFKDINPTEDKIYYGYLLEVKIIDWPFPMNDIATLIEDENGDVERLKICNWKIPQGTLSQKHQYIMQKFGPNTKLSIINPYMRQGVDGNSYIRIEDPASVIIDNSMKNKKCYCCGKEGNSLMKCKNCSMAYYCSRECQILDWKEFNHKEVCKPLSKFSMLL